MTVLTCLGYTELHWSTKPRDTSFETSWKIILINPDSTRHIQNIFDKKRFGFSLESICFQTIRDHFVTEYVKSFQEKQNDIERHLENFCAITRIPRDTLQPYVTGNNWEGFIYELVKAKQTLQIRFKKINILSIFLQLLF